MIEIKDIWKTYDDKPVIRGLSLTINTGDKIAIIGPSGCGKSTLLRLIMGLHRPDSGSICVDGADITTMAPVELKKVRDRIGMLFQSAALFDSLTVSENVAFPLVESGVNDSQLIRSIVDEKLDMVEMGDSHFKDPAELSGGQRKRIGLARALARSPQIMLYDEPTTGLDPILSTNIENLIVKLNDQLHVTSVVVTHQISTILRTADKIYMMRDGQLLPPETPESIQTAGNIYTTFINGGLDDNG
ncbi:ATP-binding cassette domain-containing protein [bacterium]|nr:ATP-binding cassette domain-containing protein [bacterium]